MSFRIHTGSAELQRQLENELAALEGQLEENFDYEITAEVLPREQAIARAEEVAQQIGAETIFAAAGTVGPEPVPIETPRPIEIEPKVTSIARVKDSRVIAQAISEPAPVHSARAPRIDTEKLKQAAAERAAQMRESLQ